MRGRPSDVVDPFVYVIVLNLAIEYVPSVISESFTLSLLTAVLLKVALELVILVKNHVLARLRAAKTRRTKTVAALSLWVVAAGSKLVVLELVNPAFGDAVSLGGFIPSDAARPRPPGITVSRTQPPLRPFCGGLSRRPHLPAGIAFRWRRRRPGRG